MCACAIVARLCVVVRQLQLSSVQRAAGGCGRARVMSCSWSVAWAHDGRHANWTSATHTRTVHTERRAVTNCLHALYALFVSGVCFAAGLRGDAARPGSARCVLPTCITRTHTRCAWCGGRYVSGVIDESPERRRTVLRCVRRAVWWCGGGRLGRGITGEGDEARERRGVVEVVVAWRQCGCGREYMSERPFLV